jgi:spore coat polysaccharide biosynthesis protein SpsF (cytidylyltransferase family)
VKAVISHVKHTVWLIFVNTLCISICYAWLWIKIIIIRRTLEVHVHQGKDMYICNTSPICWAKVEALEERKKNILKKLVQIPSKPRYDENYNIYIAYSSFFNIDGYTASPSKENRLNIPPGCRIEVMQKNTLKCCHTQATEEYNEETLLGWNSLSRQGHVYQQHLTNKLSQSRSSWRKKKIYLEETCANPVRTMLWWKL